MNRREFMMSAAAGAVLAGTKVSFAGASGARIVKRDAPARNRRPYKDLDWRGISTVRRTVSMNSRSRAFRSTASV